MVSTRSMPTARSRSSPVKATLKAKPMANVGAQSVRHQSSSECKARPAPSRQAAWQPRGSSAVRNSYFGAIPGKREHWILLTRSGSTTCYHQPARPAAADRHRSRQEEGPSAYGLNTPLVNRSASEVQPNPSLEPTRSGVALGPRGRCSYHRPRGPSATPALAAQLKR